MQPPVDHLWQGSHATSQSPESRASKLRWLHFTDAGKRTIEQKLAKAPHCEPESAFPSGSFDAAA